MSAGGEDASDGFAAFVVGASPRLRVFAELLTNDRHLAADLTQSALMAVYERWDRLDQPYSYARRCIVNGHRAWWRVWRRRETPVPLDLEGPDLQDHAAAAVTRAQVAAALAELTRREREVVVLRYFADLSEEQTGAELGIAVGTVKSAHSRALNKLRLSAHLAEERA
ncbi:RNA polymerase sigma-70 factor (sigma-E family) [Motilibacter rhizosphaerae]|uniref:RNA polymerase sigma-70 factor (Sigma-E family) n=1 Tax=Motilibacter rhizosphaerae TaxID=598652 RepID=A0A4Q7N797_9ACTN|nr:SigE family RNA polymerase sigma factor [Motilibacter rhizosphaerae]RZS77515.1 RNA polymerase sigma-70 factor (sigma-E family) [Motilibacter rhizosphaerae]